MPDMYVDATGMARIIDEEQGFIRHNGAAVVGIKLLQEMQQSSTERKQASCRTQDMTQFCG